MTKKKIEHTTISFRPEDKELYDWFLSQVKRWSDKSFTGRDALACLRTVQLHANGLTWQEWLVKAEAAISPEQEYQRKANQLALSYCPPIYPCADCGNPVVDGYCCGFCGSNNPRAKSEVTK